MGQKRDDFGVIPMCSIHHNEQHVIGWPRFILLYGLDVPAILAELREKPHIRPWSAHGGLVYFYAFFRGQEFKLYPVEFGAAMSINIATRVCGEYLRDQLMERGAA